MPRKPPSLHDLAVTALDAAWKHGFEFGADQPSVPHARRKDDAARAKLLLAIDEITRSRLAAERIVGQLRQAKERLAEGATPLPGDESPVRPIYTLPGSAPDTSPG